MADAARLHRRRRRRETGRTLVEGPRVLAEAVAAGVEPHAIFALPGDTTAVTLAAEAGSELLTVSEPVLARLSSTETPQSPVAVIPIPESELPPRGSLVVPWGVADPGNCGTLLRTAAALGMAYAEGPGSADIWSPKALRGGAGAQFRAAVASVEGLEELGDRTLIATVPADGVPPWDAGRGDMAVLIGDEGAGLPDDVIAGCHVQVTIPMPGGTESLNAAVAGAIVAYEVVLGGGRDTSRGSGSNLPAP